VPGGASRLATFIYNGYTRLASVTDNNGRSNTYGYDKAGLIKWIEDSLSANNKNRVEVKRNLQAQVIEFLRKVQKEDDQGTFTQVTYKTGFLYDELGRATVVERYGRSATKQAERRFGYDSLGRTTWFQKQLETSVFQDFEWDYDALGRVRETIRHAKTGATGTITTTTDYDDIPAAYGNDGFGTPLDASNLSRVIKRHDARGLETTYLYDVLGRLVERRMPGYTTAGAGFSWTYRHDAEGRVDKWKDGNGHVIKVTRNAEKFPIQRHIESLGTGSALSEMTKWEKWDYDSLARKVTYRTYNGPLDPTTYPPGTGDAWLVDVVREFDALGRLKAEEFGYGDNGTSTDSRIHKRLTSSYAYGGGDDTGFRRGLSLPSHWDFGFTPDGAGKTSQISLKGPNDASAGLAAHYRYEGGRAHLRDWNADPTNQQSLGFRTTWDTDELGYETRLTTVRDPSGSPTTVFDLEQGRDLEGNVLWKKFTKQVGGGDWFQNDGFNRLEEAKLGAPASDFGPGKTYAQAGFDTKLAYAMDVAHNRTSVTETQTGPPVVTNYTVDTASNRYLDAGSGLLVYDLNGNLVFDGYRLYIYDYLDRLCEVWDYYEGTASSSSSSTTREPVKLSLTEVRDLAKTRRRNAYSKDATKKGLSDYNKSTDNGRNLTSSSQSSSGPSFVLTALYGYDGMNRRTFRTTTATSEGLRYSTWDGWRMAEEYEDDGTSFLARKVYFDGIGIDGHLGYARSPDGMTWTRYSLVQDSLGHVMAVYKVGEATAIEKYEYDPYGNRTIYVRNAQGQYDLALATTVSNTYGFTGRRHDPETGFIYYRLRYYSPAMGRFITQDPIGNWGDAGNWGNAQAYAESAPATAGDPFGLLTPGPGFAGLSFDNNGGSSGLLGPSSPGDSSDGGGCTMPKPNGEGSSSKDYHPLNHWHIDRGYECVRYRFIVYVYYPSKSSPFRARGYTVTVNSEVDFWMWEQVRSAFERAVADAAGGLTSAENHEWLIENGLIPRYTVMEAGMTGELRAALAALRSCKIVKVSSKLIRFSQDSAGFEFQNPAHGTIEDLAEGLTARRYQAGGRSGHSSHGAQRKPDIDRQSATRRVSEGRIRDSG